MKTMLSKTVLLLIFIVNVISANAQSVTLTLQPGVNGKDAVIADGSPTTNFGPSTDLCDFTWTCGGSLCLERGLIQFDLSAISSASQLNSAYISLYADNNNGVGYPGTPTYGSDNAAWLRRITSQWQENTVTWNTQPTTTSSNEVTLAQSSSTSQNYINIDVTALVKDMITNGNYGFMTIPQNNTDYYNSLIFGAGDNADSTLHPKLVLNYTPTTESCTTIRLNANETNASSIADGSPATNFNNWPYTGAFTWTCGGNLCLQRSLLQFDLSAVPSANALTGAYLSLYAENNNTIGYPGTPTYGSDNSGLLKRITGPWQETTLTWNNQPATTTTHEVTLAQSNSTSQNYLEIDVTNLVRDMLTNGNYGFELMQQNEINYYNSLLFGSPSNADSTIRPKLKLCYNTGAGIYSIAKEKATAIKVYPTPASDKIIIESVEPTAGNTYVELYDMLGRKVQRLPLNSNRAEFNVASLPRGIYSYQFFDNALPVQSGKIILQ